MSTYLYQELAEDDEIRLLILEPGEEHSELSCRLVNAKLSEKPDYEAISYTWGTDAPNQHILLDGQAFPVRSNIFNVLKGYRYREKPRTLWADAICINQDNIPERSSQVKLMKNVYSNAKAVLIWLGLGMPLDQIAYDILAAVGKLLQTSEPTTGPNPLVRELIARETARDPNTVRSLEEFFNRPWFNRMWILQELVVAGNPQIHWSRYSISWDAISAVAAVVRATYDLYGGMPIYARCAHVGNMSDIRDSFAKAAPQPLGFLLRVGIGLQCSNPRDKIYAILGVMDQSEAEVITVDYSAPVEQVYESTARILYLDSLDPFSELAFVSFLGPASMDMSPSWVPNWAREPKTQRAYSHHTESHQAHGGSTPKLSFDKLNPHVLVISGFIADTIQHCPSYEAWLAETSDTSPYSWYKKCYDLCDDATYPSGETPFEAWWRAAIADTVQLPEHRGNGRAADGYGPFYLDERLSRYITGDVPLGDETDTVLRNEQLRYERYATGVSTEVNFCVTEKGYIGWTPLFARPGDLLCVFAGAKAPFVLRREGDKGFRAIGDAYVHGWMSGEVLGFNGFAWEDIRLC